MAPDPRKAVPPKSTPAPLTEPADQPRNLGNEALSQRVTIDRAWRPHSGRLRRP